jgi:DNA invertase Pin-like site-specific DNA recombinase
MKTKAIALLRSATKSNQAINTQRQCIEDYSEKHNIKILKFYTENGVNGWSMEENRLTHIFSDINKNLDCPSILLVTSKDRISRNIKYLIDATADFETKGIKVISVKEEMKSESDDCKRISKMVSEMINEIEHRLRSQVIKAAKSKLAKIGCFPGGYIPFGYTTVSIKTKGSHKERKKLVIHREESEIVKNIFKLASLCSPLNKKEVLGISNQLNENGVNHREKPWTRKKVFNVINNPVYFGEYHWGVKKGANGTDNLPIIIWVQGIITKELFIQIKNQLDKNSK